MPNSGQPSGRCWGPVARREFLQAGSLALGGTGLAEILAGRASAGKTDPTVDTSVILLYLHGGPSHLETYDLKPHAPVEYRSVYRPIRTNVLGLELCERFPQQARLADKIAIVRSLSHEMSSHSDGGIEVLTGKTPRVPDPTSQSKSEHPDLGSVVSHVRRTETVPPYVAIPRSTYMTRPAYLGLQHGAFVVPDPSAPGYRPPIGRLAAGLDGRRLADRKFLQSQLDRFRTSVDVAGEIKGVDHFRQQAFQVLASSKTAAAFDLEQEPEDLRRVYGHHRWGQSCLLARRLCQAGVGVVSLYIDTPKTGPKFTNWDDHVLNAGRPGHFATFMDRRLPYLDQALSALISDIYSKELDQQIMVVVMGEFGRTPRLSQNAQGVGRNHWPQAYSVLFSGGGLKTGQVVGATNDKGEYPTERPCSPRDVLATIYRHLGIDGGQMLRDHAGRPVAILNDGRPIPELI